MRIHSTSKRMGLVAALAALVLLPSLHPVQAGTKQSGRVTKVVDGDTFDIDLNRDGKADATIRLIGIDTPEMGACGSYSAKKALTSLLNKRWVTLYSDGKGTTGFQDRWIRGATVVKNGETVDAAQWMLERGHGPWRPFSAETSRHYRHHLAAARASAAGLRYFDPDRCGAGPGDTSALDMQVQWRADILAGKNTLNQEFARITNNSSSPIDVSNWHLRSGGMRGLRVPSGLPIEAGKTLTIHIGDGTNSPYHRYLKRDGFLFPDIPLGSSGPHKGEGFYMLDGDGDLRAYQTYPCIRRCADPTAGALKIVEIQYDVPSERDADFPNREWIRLKNTGTVPIHTGNLVLEVKPVIYEFPPSHWIQPDETVTVFIGPGDETQDERHLGWDTELLRNVGDQVLIRTYDAIIVACKDWGDVHCPS